MPRNGSGTYNLPAGNPVSPNTTIQSSWANTTLQDIAAALTASLTADGQKTPTANLPMGSFKHTGVANASARTEYAAAGQVQDFAYSWCGTAGGTADAITLSPTPGIAAYAAGQVFWFIPASANTGAMTVAVSGLGTKALTKNGTTAMSAGDLSTSRIYSITYDGTRFQLSSDPLGTYAPLNSPAFTGTPTVPTAAAGTNTTQAASTAFVQTAISGVSPVAAEARNARMSVTSASDSATFTADEVVVKTALAGTPYTLGSYSKVVNLLSTGAGGMDTGSAPLSGFVSLYAIYNPSTAAASILACNVSTSSGTIYSGLNMPAGYTASALIGVWPTNGSGQFKAGYLIAREVYFAPVEVYSSASGNPTTYTSLSLSSAVPSVAKTANGVIGSSTTNNTLYSVAGDANGIGGQTFLAADAGNTLDGFVGSMSFREIPLITAQTLYWKAFSASQNARVTINGYTF